MGCRWWSESSSWSVDGGVRGYYSWSVDGGVRGLTRWWSERDQRVVTPRED